MTYQFDCAAFIQDAKEVTRKRNRHLKKVSIRQVAEEAQVAHMTLYFIHRGRTPTVSTLTFICNQLELNPSNYFKRGAI